MTQVGVDYVVLTEFLFTVFFVAIIATLIFGLREREHSTDLKVALERLFETEKQIRKWITEHPFIPLEHPIAQELIKRKKEAHQEFLDVLLFRF